MVRPRHPWSWDKIQHTPRFVNIMVPMPAASHSYPARFCVIHVSRVMMRWYVIKVDVMLLYTDAALAVMGDATAGEMETTLTKVVETTNEAFSNSEIPLKFSLVHVAKVRVQQYTIRIV